MQIDTWKTPIKLIVHLANQRLHQEGIGRIEVSFEDIDSNVRHIFHFEKVLGFRFVDAFNLQRLGNTFIVTHSPWIDEMRTAPQRTVKLDSARHYMFSSMDGEIEVVALLAPTYRTCDETAYVPFSKDGLPLEE